MMRATSLSLATLLALVQAPAWAVEPAATTPAAREELQSALSTREITIKSNFTGIEILIYGSIDFSQTAAPKDSYDVITVIRAPAKAIVEREKARVAGIWINGPGKVYPDVPGFYAALSTRPFRAITSDETLQKLGIGLVNLDFGRSSNNNLEEETFRSALIRLKEEQGLFQEHDDAVSFLGRSLFRANVALPVNVPIGRYTADIYLFSDGKVITKNQSTLEVTKAGLERLIYLLAFEHPFVYGLIAVALAGLAGLAGWAAFRRD